MAKKASDNFKVYVNPNGYKISTVGRKIIEKDKMFFKDIDGTGEVSKVNDWRLPPKTRADEYVKLLSIEEKIPQLFISDWRMGKYKPAGFGANPDHEPVLDESGTLDEAPMQMGNIFGNQLLPGTTTLIKEWFNRHIILRANPTPEDMTDFMNQLQAVAEECQHFVPVQAASNSRNENGQVVFGMNDAAGVFPAWPGTLGIAAAVKGDGIHIADEWAEAVNRDWNACNLRKGYMYMVDCVTDPRWQRTFGTFGEDTNLICEIAEHIIPRIQGSKEGVTTTGVAVTIKHFPGGGARENGFDPHYAEGQWNVYRTKDSLLKYHLPPFASAIKCNTSSIMPYYAKPSLIKSAPQKDDEGKDIPMDAFGFAFNRHFIKDLMKDKMGFKGYINTDTGVIHNMDWGVEELDKAERIGFAINNSKVSLISGFFDNQLGMEIYNRGKNGYYDGKTLPYNLTSDQVILTDEAVNRAVSETMTEMFALGMFDDSYRDSGTAAKACALKSDWDKAYDAHLKSVTLLKNDSVLPLKADKSLKVIARAYNKNPKAAKKATDELHKLLSQVTLVDDANEADVALVFVTPDSGNYFNATKGFLELDICENKKVCDVDDKGCPIDSIHEETTLCGLKELTEIAHRVRSNGGKVVTNVNITLAWQLGNIEPLSDALLAGYDTYCAATLDVIFGKFNPVGRLPITLPKNDAVIAVNADGICVSPNDVPGYVKDEYMPDAMKDEYGKAYAYRDAAGHYYELAFGLG